MTDKLKPCPFCGGEAAFIGDSRSIKCKNCGGAFLVTNPVYSRLDAKEAWNRRGGRMIFIDLKRDTIVMQDHGIYYTVGLKFYDGEKCYGEIIEIRDGLSLEQLRDALVHLCEAKKRVKEGAAVIDR